MSQDTESPTIHKLCQKSERSVITKMIKREKALLSAKDDEYGQTILHVCAEYGREDLVQYLLSDRFAGKVDINAVDKNGWTPLHSACKGGHLGIIQLLVNKGAFCRALTNEGASPLHYLVRNLGFDKYDCHKAIKLLVDKSSAVDVTNRHGETPLHQAAMRGRAQNILYLLNLKANPNAVTAHGDSALHLAARGNHAETVNVLLQMSANPNLVSPESGNVYSTARSSGATDVCKVLYKWFFKHSLEFTPEMLQDEEICLAVDSDENSSVSEDFDDPAPSTPDVKKTPNSKQRAKKRTKPALKSHLSGGSRKRPLPSSPMLRVNRDGDQSSPTKYRQDSVGAAGKSAESLPIPTSRKRSNSCAVDPFTPPAAHEDLQVPSLEQRIELLKSRVANANVEGLDSRNTDLSAPSIHVGSIVQNFERLSKQEQAANIDYRIERLKRDVSRVIDPSRRRSSLESLEPTTSSSRDLSRESSRELRESETGVQITPPDILKQTLAQMNPLPNSALTKHELLQKLKDGWECRVCKNKHQDVPLFFFCACPQDYEELPAANRTQRSKLSADLCSIDNLKFFVRGLLEIPIRLSEDKAEPSNQIFLTWGVWVAVATEDFYRLMQSWTDPTPLVIKGLLNSLLPFYNDTLNISVTVTTRPGGLRPLIELNSTDSLLAKDKREGLSVLRLENLLEIVLHKS